MFVDEVHITVRSGRGGNGVVAFRREKYVPRGGPAGGDGGKGGNVILAADPQLGTLIDFRYQPHHAAENGRPGGTSRKSGRDGADLVVCVPQGTLVYDDDTDQLLADLAGPGSRVLVCRGGKGGRGNQHFATASSQTPDIAERGEPAEERRLRLELRLVADVGVIGFPNVGKSTLISVVSAARPKIADYPFTTLQPNLGVVRLGIDRSFVIADMPGLIVGAHEGAGLGDRFLRHISRTRLLIHMLDAAALEGRDPLDDLGAINAELALYGDPLPSLPQIVALNKMDLPDAAELAEMTAEALAARGCECFPISAATREGVDELMEAAWARIAELPEPVSEEAEPELIVATPPDERPLDVRRPEPGLFIVSGTDVERAAAVAWLDSTAGLARFHRELGKLGVLEALAEAAAEEGDTVKIGDTEFEYAPDEPVQRGRRRKR
jgi:GTP-binding protein